MFTCRRKTSSAKTRWEQWKLRFGGSTSDPGRLISRLATGVCFSSLFVVFYSVTGNKSPTSINRSGNSSPERDVNYLRYYTLRSPFLFAMPCAVYTASNVLQGCPAFPVPPPYQCNSQLGRYQQPISVIGLLFPSDARGYLASCPILIMPRYQTRLLQDDMPSPCSSRNRAQ